MTIKALLLILFVIIGIIVMSIIGALAEIFATLYGEEDEDEVTTRREDNGRGSQTKKDR